MPVNCPVYQKPLCAQGEHIEIITNAAGCKEPVCVADADPCPTIAAPDATFCPKGQVLLDAAQCNWVCHGGDRCPFIGEFAECQGTTVIESDPATHCLTGIQCLPTMVCSTPPPELTTSPKGRLAPARRLSLRSHASVC